ncbi:membrane metalloendopeptidase [Flavobacteriales bacterium ALC-1]|nr:membrane metalloendopeptidase [Flavobacteriales bacterium ALC-1]
MKQFLCLFVLLLVANCDESNQKSAPKNIEITEEPQNESLDYQKLFYTNSDFKTKGFDFPVGKPNAVGYYNAQKFQENNHLGDDWNGVKGGNSDLGDPIYAIANGYISETKDYEGGWGKVIRIVHLLNGKLYESLYAHCDSIVIKQNQFIIKGEQIATIGNCNGAYYAHLHLEIRDSVDMDIGGGYSTNTTGYIDPTEFINKNRK